MRWIVVFLSVFLFASEFKSITPKVKVAIVVDKKRFFKFIPSFINSITAYYMLKDVDLNLRVFSKIEDVPSEYRDIIYLSFKPFNTKARVYIPLENKKSSGKIFYGGVDWKKQVEKLSNLVYSSNVASINDATYISNLLYNYEKEYFSQIKRYFYPSIPYYRLKGFVFFNIGASKTAQVLSKLTYLNITSQMKLSTQINYDPLLLEVTQPMDVKNLVIANSIINPPLMVEDYALLLNGDIKYNWLNYAGVIFANKIYNLQNSLDMFYMHDFGVYIFNNQINYDVKLYRIIKHSFKEF